MNIKSLNPSQLKYIGFYTCKTINFTFIGDSARAIKEFLVIAQQFPPAIYKPSVGEFPRIFKVFLIQEESIVERVAETMEVDYFSYTCQ